MKQLIEKSEIVLSLGVKAFKAKSIKHLVVIFIIFAISGSVAVFCSKFLLLLLNLDRQFLGNYIYWPIRLLVLLIAYQFILLFVSTIFGEFNHFKKYSLKFISIIRKIDPFKAMKKYYNFFEHLFWSYTKISHDQKMLYYCFAGKIHFMIV